MQTDQDRIRSGHGSFPAKDDSLERQPGDENIDDPDTERLDDPSDPDEDLDDF